MVSCFFLSWSHRRTSKVQLLLQSDGFREKWRKLSDWQVWPVLALEVQKKSHEREEKSMPGVTDLGLGAGLASACLGSPEKES